MAWSRADGGTAAADNLAGARRHAEGRALCGSTRRARDSVVLAAAGGRGLVVAHPAALAHVLLRPRRAGVALKHTTNGHSLPHPFLSGGIARQPAHHNMPESEGGAAVWQCRFARVGHLRAQTAPLRHDGARPVGVPVLRLLPNAVLTQLRSWRR